MIVTDILPRFESSRSSSTVATSTWAAALGGASAVFLETPSNPSLEVIDLAAVSDLAHAAGTLVWSTTSSPRRCCSTPCGPMWWCTPPPHRRSGPHARRGGACGQAFHDDHLQDFLRHTGPSLSPFNAWVLLKGSRLSGSRRYPIRSCRTSRSPPCRASCGAVVRYPFLESHPDHDVARRQVEAGGTIVCLELNGDQARTFEVINALEIFDISNNLGDTRAW